MKTIRTRKFLFCSSILLMVACSVFSGTALNNRTSNNSVLILEQSEDTQHNIEIEPRVSSTDNYETIESIFAQKLTDYSQLGYFPQYYESSLQATYYALYILEALGKLYEIDQGQVLDYIMSHYNEDTHVFMDKYSYRFSLVSIILIHRFSR